MKLKKTPKASLIIIAALLLWVKTYIVYKTSFDIKIENTLQELILFINPLSFLLFIFGVGLLLKKDKSRTRYIIAASFVLSFILYGNVVFYRFFDDFLTLPVLFQTSNFSDLGTSASAIMSWKDLFYFTDVIVLILIIKLKPTWFSLQNYSRANRRAYFLVATALVFFNLGLAESERPQLLTRTFDREMLVKNIGTYNYHVYDIFLQSKSSAQRAMADGSELADIDNYVRASYIEPDKEMFGVAKDKNLIMVSLESLQNFVINSEMNGQEITPFLNDFIGESYYFDNFYHQTQQGKTSDSEFLLDNSLYPLNRGAVFFTHSGNEFESMTEKLGENGYYTTAMHANNKSFWNRDIMYDSLGYERFYSLPDYEVTEENSVNWGMKDIPFFEQSVEHMKEMPQPFSTKMITLTNHYPFTLDEEDKLIDPYTSNDGTVNRYFQTVRYMDEAVKNFITDLKESGLYENSVIVMYGDHYGISENHNKAMSQYLGKEVTPVVSTQLQEVPLIIHVPGQEGKTISKVSGQIDLKPTIMHLLGIDTKEDIQFGSDIFSSQHEDLAILRDGRFITEDYVFAGEKCWNKESEETTDMKYCEPYKERVNEELEYSDKIINGDLLRFYGENEEDDE
ncbi:MULTISPECIES: LTA synthase family protein [Rossellomorea]|jgi:lipoteichoic acid synthase|uniref:LTA synthase family protein n=1 Tax=Rossellomorea TaxID=2837508 RepID=UPI0011E9009F|nr:MULTISPECIES: LTA synthase family protein [Rossellomorea]MDT9024860.1 LTA synthase family protein [Rossellomorea sp. YC4-1]TYS87621.1 LTA synthase family protein [Rossellomorea aquimaris]